MRHVGKYTIHGSYGLRALVGFVEALLSEHESLMAPENWGLVGRILRFPWKKMTTVFSYV